MSLMWPSRSSRQRGTTRMPIDIVDVLADVDRVQQRRVGAVDLDQRPRERSLDRMLRASGRVTHAYVVTVPPGPDLDQFGERLAGRRVVLHRRHEHAAVLGLRSRR